MKSTHFLCGLLLLSMATSALSQKTPKTSKLTQEFSKLQKDYYAAIEKYYAPQNKAKTNEERAKIKLDPKLDPALKFAPLFIAIAKRAKNDPGGPAFEFTITQVASFNSKLLQDSLDRLLKWHLNHPLNGIGMVAIMQGYLYMHQGKEHSEYPKALKMISEMSKLVENRAAAELALGSYWESAYLNPHTDVKMSTSYYQNVIAKYPKSKSAMHARGSIFELENLQVGMIAPDFEQIDQDGKSWKLSDYRGQVIVLDFWGFW